MSDGDSTAGDIFKDFLGQMGDLPSEVISDAGKQIAGDDGAKIIEQGQSGGDDGNNSGNVINKANNDAVASARAEELRAKLKSMIEGEIQEYRNTRKQEEHARDEDWEARMQRDEQVKEQEKKQVQDRVAAMIYQERAGSGETGKRKG